MWLVNYSGALYFHNNSKKQPLNNFINYWKIVGKFVTKLGKSSAVS